MTDQAHAMQIAERLIALRKQYGISQEGLADQLSVSRQAVSKWETGQTLPETEKLIRLADLYSVSLDDLLRKESFEGKPAVQQQGLQQQGSQGSSPTSTSNTSSTSKTSDANDEDWGDDSWCAVDTPKSEPTIDVDGEQMTKTELADEMVYGIATVLYILLSFTTGKWSAMWVVFPMAYFVTLILRYRRAK